MAESSQEKTEQPTPRKLQDAKKKGQVAKSKDLSAALVLMAAVLFFFMYSNETVVSMGGYLSWYFSNCFSFNLPDDQMYTVMVNSLLEVVTLVVPLILFIMAMGFIANVLQTGFFISSDAVAPKFERMNPIEGIKKLLSVDSLVEMVKSILKILVVGIVSYVVAIKYIPEMLMIYFKNPQLEILEIVSVLLVIAFSGGMVFLVLAMIDFYYQKYSFNKKMKMSMQEVKDEYKNSEGDPQIKGWLRKRQREIAMNRISEEVPKATVVLTNPIHYAVALKYEEGISKAPVVLAKGAGDIALRVKEVAANYNIPIIENPPLARLLFKQVEVGSEIPVELYQTVAEVLAMVYKIKTRQY
ncbi:MAG: flagellar biosynthesis protein FlhB [Peptococcaceae bacterium]|nr:flagellar biosynthesis protein FlhB [Peptococcaceae bacterium]